MKTSKTDSYYPVFLNITDKKCVVVGGGDVALRKAKILLEHGASVEVISPAICTELERLAADSGIKLLRREYRNGDLEGAFLTVAATDSEQTNREVVAGARSAKVLVNVVDDAAKSDFIVPSYLRRGDITVAVSTNGRSPALARKIRTRLERDFGEEYASLTMLVDEARRELKSKGVRMSGDAWQQALELDSMLALLRNGQAEEAKTMLRRNLEALVKTGKAG